MSIEVTVPQLGESIVEATVGRWLKQPGEAVGAGETLVELETDKVNMEVAAPDAGTLQEVLKQEGDTVAIGEILAVIDENGAAPVAGEVMATGERVPQPAPAPQPAPSSTPEPAAQAQEAVESADGGRSTPLARRIAAEHGVDLNQVKGSGPSGRVTKEDVTAFLESRARQPAAPPQKTQPVARAASPPAPDIETETEGRREEIVRMSRRRLTIARRLVEAQHTAAMLTTFNEVDMSGVMELRKRHRDSFRERHGVGLGFMSFFTKASVGALKDYPRLNAEIQGDDMILKYYYDVGVAVGTDQGLVVPVVRDADRLGFAEIERQIGELAERARTGQLTLEELQGGTFTLSNGGIYGSLLSTPILNTPQVGILGMHKIQERPVVIDGQIAVRPMMYLALSYDHRIVDGSEAVRFLVRIKELLENPELLMLEG